MNRIPLSLSAFLFLHSVLPAQAPLAIFGARGETFRSYYQGMGEASPGSVVVINTANDGLVTIGPAERQEAAGFPLQTSLAGTSVRVVPADGQPLDAFVLGTDSVFVRILLPSATPVGIADLVVTYDGTQKGKARIKVVKRQFGLYTEFFAYPQALGRKTAQNADSAGGVALNAYNNPARPGQIVILWGGGFGAAAGNETSGDNIGDLRIPGIQVLVGGVIPANVLYAGRSGCCAGIDVVIFEVPEGISGCDVPVWVRSDEDPEGSNEAMVSISAREGACSDPHGYTEAEARAAAEGKKLIGAILRADGNPLLPFMGWTLVPGWTLELGSAAQPPDGFPPSENLRDKVLALGACVTSWGVWPFGPRLQSLIDAGPVVNIATPRAPIQAAKGPDNRYGGPFDGRLDTGDYAVSNSAGGVGLGPLRFSFSLEASQPFQWIDTATADTNVPLKFAWTGGAPNEFVDIAAGWYDPDDQFWRAFHCAQPAAAGEFVLPGSVYERVRSRFGAGAKLSVIAVPYSTKRINVPGFDIGKFVFAGTAITKTLELR
jgi:uncharacterized protein (TIGR03437 family)